ncbi:receptor-interacting serine/threonine-protein kinase 4-like [Brienomyrus brachyistius]|uniref:receptor-interacting serine/threonine-protein kinase 4-like n=1 Tax=Brienomyrus brachyistius TaxID=42636 RepID=UPI0020B29571|nr:receptor-interacting serine/threonine-protein kinase 4-like [Brienomyrus brachyistius]
MELKSINDSVLESWKMIGKGGFGQVYKARHKTWGKDVAVKVLHQSDSSALQKEVHLMCKASSFHVVQIIGEYSGFPPGTKSVTSLQGLVMECMERGSLESLLKNLDGPPPWPLVLRFAHHVAVGLNYLHSLTPQMLHLDLKPSNVLLDSSLNAKVTDFGLARILSSTSLSKKSVGGTTNYMPPEAFSLSYKPNPASDVYSYAILLCSIVKGEQPYPCAVSSVVRLCIPEGGRPDLNKLPFGSEAKGLEDVLCLIRRCWEGEPQERPRISVCMQETERLLEPLEYEVINAVHEVLTSLSQTRGKSVFPTPLDSPPEATPQCPQPVTTPTPVYMPSKTVNHDRGDGEVMKVPPMTSVIPAQNSEDSKLININQNILPKYKMDANPCGLCLIINNENYLPESHLTRRIGSRIDFEKLVKRFRSFNFIVDDLCDLKDKELRQQLLSLSKKDHTTYDCCIVVILSHGSKSGQHLYGAVHGVDGATVTVENITRFLNGNSCPSLQGKPKLFFIQACTGAAIDKGSNVSPEEASPSLAGVYVETDVIPTSSSSDSLSASEETDACTSLPVPSDILVSYSTYPGYVSWRDKKKGSWYVETLDQILEEHAATCDLVTMLTMVNNKVAQNSALGVYKQTPASFNSLRKLLYFQSSSQVHS